jgi:hypothetical protein
MGKSPKIGKKVMVVKELEKQPNGSFLAQPVTAGEEETNSPRLKRSGPGAAAKKSSLEPPKEAQVNGFSCPLLSCHGGKYC